jgi:hypothetical protein
MNSRIWKEPRSVMCLGLMFMVLGSTCNVLLRRSRLVSEDWVDFLTGLFYGLAIATLLLYIVRRRSSPPRT